MNSNLSIVSSLLSDRGIKRTNNEDFATFFVPPNPEILEQYGRIYLIADGVGGAAEGERASRFAADCVKHEYYQLSEVEPGERLRQAYISANNQIYQYAEFGGRQMRMATTLVSAVILNNHLWVANVGDSRAYLIRDGQAMQITNDHNTVGEMVKNGLLTEEQAFFAKGKNRLNRSIGGEPEVHVDVFQPLPLQSGDKILLCTDGLTRYARNLDIVNLTAEGEPEDIVGKLVDFAKNNGGADNVSVLLIAIGAYAMAGEPGKPSLDHGMAPSDDYLELLTTVPLKPLQSLSVGNAHWKNHRPVVVFRSRGRNIAGSSGQLSTNIKPFGVFLVVSVLLVFVGLLSGLVLAKNIKNSKLDSPDNQQKTQEIETLVALGFTQTKIAELATTVPMATITTSPTPSLFSMQEPILSQGAIEKSDVLPTNTETFTPTNTSTQSASTVLDLAPTETDTPVTQQYVCVKLSQKGEGIRYLFTFDNNEMKFYNFPKNNCEPQENPIRCVDWEEIKDINLIQQDWWIFPDPNKFTREDCVRDRGIWVVNGGKPIPNNNQ